MPTWNNYVIKDTVFLSTPRSKSRVFFASHTGTYLFWPSPQGPARSPSEAERFHLSFHAQVVGFPSFSGSFWAMIYFFYKQIRTRVDLSDIISRQNGLQDFPRVSFPFHSPRFPFQNLLFSRKPGPFWHTDSYLIKSLFSFFQDLSGCHGALS